VHLQLAPVKMASHASDRVTKEEIMLRQMVLAAAALCACVAGGTVGADEKAKVYTPQTAFEALESLVGQWVRADEPDAKPSMSVRMTGAGSAVTTTFFPGQEMEMLSLFHLDGPKRLVHTHYCALHNQPTMHMIEVGRPGVIRFEFVSGTNMDVNKDPHAHNTEIQLLDDGKIKVIVEARSEGKLSNTQESILQRVAAKADAAAAAK
jgi:hypothetical protein